MAAALAIKQGLFTLEDDVRKFVPELPDYGTPIKVRHLIHHTSGLRDINTIVATAGLRDEVAFDNDAVLRVLARQKALNFTPGDCSPT
jgi:CubicO group peptidase (beta-lactamase class C family)